MAPCLQQAGVDLRSAFPRLRRYAELVLEWNRGFSNLISGNDEHRFVERHLLESLQPASWLAECGVSRWMDLGSGAGLPAIPLAIAGVGRTWTLVEARRNKCLFMKKAVLELGLANVHIEEGRLESLAAEIGRLGRFDGFTSRATLRLGPTLALAARWTEPGASAFLWKGSGLQREMGEYQAWKESWRAEGLARIGPGPMVVARFIRTADR